MGVMLVWEGARRGSLSKRGNGYSEMDFVEEKGSFISCELVVDGVFDDIRSLDALCF